ncbi:MAG: glutamate-1-semialdehyde 2,1-aminomutase [Cyclobacteriaceae bacterium]
MKILAITQARYGSTRLPGKILLKVNGKTLLETHLHRILKSKKIDELIVATTQEPQSGLIIDIAKKMRVGYFQGSTENVLERFYSAAKPISPDYVVRLTSDCPLIDSKVIDRVIEKCLDEQLDYCSNTLDPTFPDGIDVEVFTYKALEKAFMEAALLSEKEHVTPFIWKQSTFLGGRLFSSANLYHNEDLSSFRITLDTASDFEVISNLIKMKGIDCEWLEYIDILKANNGLNGLNSTLLRNEGFQKSMIKDKTKLRIIENFAQSENYRSRIHDLIPGGAHTYSKGDDQFPEQSPAAIVRGKGSHVWDVDGNEYLDCSMGLTSVSLGHAYDPIVKRVQAELENGVNFQRPSVLEKDMAEKFLALVPQHDRVKFAKNGSIVTTAAVKLARAFTGRKLVAFPGDHPFYSYDDWFIGKTECNLGVPEEISQLSVTFKSCNIDSLRQLFEEHPDQIACVIMEPEKNSCGNGCSCSINVGDYLNQAIELSHRHGALFIVDEMITGFKTALPGSITKYDIKPDMATWGKGIANGFSFCALTGTKEIMELGGIRNEGDEKVFLISTTHGGETHALAAGISTIHEFISNNVIDHNHRIGNLLIDKCNSIIAKWDLNEYVQIIPCNWMPIFTFRNQKKEVCSGMRTFAMQEMIKRSVLFQGAFVPCFSHSPDDIEYFATAFDHVLELYKDALKQGYEKFLIGAPVKPVFRKKL